MENKNESCDGCARPRKVAEATITQWRRFVRQTSEMVLPIDERENPANDIELETRTEMIDHEVLDQERREYFPTFMIGISIIQVLYYAVFDDRWLTLVFGYDPHRRHEIWRYLTANLVHSSVLHLGGNLVMQLILGVLLEIVHRCRHIAIIYLVSGAGGTFLASVYDKKDYTVGASAAAMGLLFSHLSTILLNWNAMDYKMSRFFSVLLYIAWVHIESLRDSNVSHAGHVGGAVTGFLVSILVLKTYKKHSWRKTKQWICIGILIVISVIIFLINITSSEYPPSEWNFSYKETYKNYANITYNVTVETNFPVFRNYSSFAAFVTFGGS